MANERAYRPIGHLNLIPRGGLLADLVTADFGIALGTEIRDDRGNVFRFIKANETLAEGDALTAVAEAAWDTTIVTDGAVAVGDTKIHVDTNTSVITADQFAGYYIRQAAAASKGKAYRIKSHPAISASSEMDVQLYDNASEVISDGVALLLYHPFLYEKVDATTEVVKGVAIGTITSGQYGWVQVGGYFQAVKVGGTTSAAVVLNEPLTPIGNATNGPDGSLMGIAGSTEADIFEATASQLYALSAVNADTPGFIAAYSKGVL